MLGFHVSIIGSIPLAVDRALEIGCTTFQIFTRNPRGWAFGPLGDESVELFKQKRRKAGYKKVVAHMPYLPNLSASAGTFQKASRASLNEEMVRCGRLEMDYLVAHVGSHMGAGTMAGVRNVIAACNEALEANEYKTVLLIETAAGQKNSVGSRFEELRAILDGVKRSDRMGVCMDTCHVYASGFDISNKPGVEHTMGLFAEVVGYDRLKVAHINDSVGGLGSGLDRHEHIGMGRVGLKGMRSFLNYKKNSKLPLLMETPIDERRRDEDNMKIVRRLIAAEG